MANDIFDALFEEKIDEFKNSFMQTAKKVFYDPCKQNGIRHTGEYGAYRENTSKSFLRFFIPEKLSIGKGFIINSNNEVSTECDLVVFSSLAAPLIQSDELQRFFPVETVVGIGEIKSNLSLKQLEEALIKLSQNKKIRDFIGVEQPSPIFRYTEGTNPYNPTKNHFDQVPTFLICNKFDFKFSKDTTGNLVNIINDIYVRNNIDVHHRHNLMLSLEDGLVFYNGELDGESLDSPYPNSPQENIKIKWITSDDGRYHIKMFCSFMYQITSFASIMCPDIGNYMKRKEVHQWFRAK